MTVLPLALQTYSGIEVTAGNFTKAAMLLDESRVITSATGAPLPGCLWAYLAAFRGKEQQCREIVETTISRAQERGEGFDIDGALYSVAILHLGLSQYPEALAAASSARQHDDVGVLTHILNELVEAAARCGERSIAKDAADELQQQAQVCGTDTALGMAARAVALVSDGPAADAAYQAAIDHLQRSPFAVYLPRAHLVYGEWLRREKRRAEARVQLRAAHNTFVQVRAEGFANRALRELRATGEPVLARGHGSITRLTTREAQMTLARRLHELKSLAALHTPNGGMAPQPHLRKTRYHVPQATPQQAVRRNIAARVARRGGRTDGSARESVITRKHRNLFACLAFEDTRVALNRSGFDAGLMPASC